MTWAATLELWPLEGSMWWHPGVLKCWLWLTSDFHFSILFFWPADFPFLSWIINRRPLDLGPSTPEAWANIMPCTSRPNKHGFIKELLGELPQPSRTDHWGPFSISYIWTVFGYYLSGWTHPSDLSSCLSWSFSLKLFQRIFIEINCF